MDGRFGRTAGRVAWKRTVRGEKAAEALRRDSQSAVFVQTDVASEADWARFGDVARNAWGGIEILVNNAFSTEVAAAHEMSVASWDRQLAVEYGSQVWVNCVASPEASYITGAGLVVDGGWSVVKASA